MIKKILIVCLLLITSLYSSVRSSEANKIQQLIEQEEYIGKMINRYILQTGTLPFDDNTNKLVFSTILTSEYLGVNFNKKNFLLGNDIFVEIDRDYNIYIKGLFANKSNPKMNEHKQFFYQHYVNPVDRKYTYVKNDMSLNNFKLGARVLYSDAVKKIVKVIDKENKKTTGRMELVTEYSDCPKENFFHELKDGEIKKKYCKKDGLSFYTYQTGKIFVEDIANLQHIKTTIGNLAYAKNGNSWSEYYYQGDVDFPWIRVRQKDRTKSLVLKTRQSNSTMELAIGSSSGCRLAGGDIFCWGDNNNKKSGLKHGQDDATLIPKNVNAPVMLKSTPKTEDAYNRDDSTKFISVAIGDNNVCAISQTGELYCNGYLYKHDYNIGDSIPSLYTALTSILHKSKYLKDVKLKQIVISGGTTAVLSTSGDIYTFGYDNNGSLGQKLESELLYLYQKPKKINGNVKFTDIYAFRNSETFIAVNENKEHQRIRMWGEKFRPDDTDKTMKEISVHLKVNNKTKFFTTGDSYSFDQNSGLVTLTHDGRVSYGNQGVYLYLSRSTKELKSGAKGRSANLLACRNKSGASCNTADSKLFQDSIIKFNSIDEKTTDVPGNQTNLNEVSVFDNQKLRIVYDFEDKDLSDFVKTNDTEIKIVDTFTTANVNLKFKKKTSISQSASNKYNFGVSHANKEVTISMDIYKELKVTDITDAMKKEKILHKDKLPFDLFLSVAKVNIYVNDSIIKKSNSTSTLRGRTIYNKPTEDVPKFSMWRITFKVKLNKNGEVKIGFGTRVKESEDDEKVEDPKDDEKVEKSKDDETVEKPKDDEKVEKPKDDEKVEALSIDNLSLSVSLGKPMVCATLGKHLSSQLYCWGGAGYALPSFNTSMHTLVNSASALDVKRLFVGDYTDIEDSLFLKYPTYIGGFNYMINFK